jgi:hypothetical protein
LAAAAFVFAAWPFACAPALAFPAVGWLAQPVASDSTSSAAA